MKEKASAPHVRLVFVHLHASFATRRSQIRRIAAVISMVNGKYGRLQKKSRARRADDTHFRSRGALVDVVSTVLRDRR
jgi:hypothetical protein